jgi:hypothetical protein
MTIACGESGAHHFFSPTLFCFFKENKMVCAGCDPHLYLAHGGQADFRGVDNTFFNVLTARNVSWNIKTTDTLYNLRHFTVNGSFFTESYMMLMTSNDNFLNISTRLQPIKNDIWCGSHKIAYKPFSNAYCDDIRLDFKHQSLRVSTQEWILDTIPKPIYNPLTTLNYRIDIVCSLRVPESRLVALPYGFIGQSFDGDGFFSFWNA